MESHRESLALRRSEIEGILLEDIPDGSDGDTDFDDEDEDSEGMDDINMFDAVFNEEVDRVADGLEDVLVAEDDVTPDDTPTGNGSGDSINPSTSAEPATSTKKRSDKTKKPKVVPLNRKWKKRKVDADLPYYHHPLGVSEDLFASCDTPTDIFISLIDSILDDIVYQSNLYATQRGKTLAMAKKELLSFIGINFLMGYNRLPSWKDYWASSQDLGVTIVSKCMSRNRFDAILTNLHVNDNTMVPVNNKDKLYKLRPMIVGLNESFGRATNGTREVSIDESMILFKGRSSLKQYNPMKPIKRGYKIWCMADQTGFIMKFKIYQGKEEECDEFKDFGLGERVVLELTKNEWGKNRKVYFDNYFTSLPLLEKLKTEQTLACGTIRSNRKGLPDNFTVDKVMKRGDYDFRMSTQEIGVFKWMDNKAVYISSNFHGSADSSSVQRTQKDGTKLTVLCPTVIEDYNRHMGGVDHADQLRALYCVSRKSRKWWHRIFFGLLDISFVNSFNIYIELHDKMSVKEFRRAVAVGLITLAQIPTAGRPSSEKRKNSVSSDSQPCKRRGTGISVPKDMRMGNRGCHWPLFVAVRGRCEQCSTEGKESRPFSKCLHCKVYLCCNKDKNCFAKFHAVQWNP